MCVFDIFKEHNHKITYVAIIFDVIHRICDIIRVKINFGKR